MKDSDTLELVAIGLSGLFAITLSASICYKTGYDNLKAEIVKRGHATWEVSEDGRTVKFVWKELDSKK